MKAVRIVFQTIEDDGAIGLERSYDTSALELTQAKSPLLPETAKREAEKFWEVVVGMGKVDP